MDNKEYLKYWRNIHNDVIDDLAVVCFPDKPMYFNLFFDRIQRYALSKYLEKEHIPLSGSSLLDIGCGRGRWLSFYQTSCQALVTGIDLSPAAVQSCMSKGFNAIEGTITGMPFEDASFDIVNSITVLLHLPYELKGKAAKEISRVLKPGGKAILIESTWNDPSSHVFGMSVDEWQKLFADNGMTLGHESGHCFNLFRRVLPDVIPLKDFIAIHLDYPLEYVMMNYFYGRQSAFSLQHLMVFEK